MKRWLKILFSLLLLGIAIYFLDWPTLQEVFLKLSPKHFFIYTIISFCQFPIMAVRWHYLINTYLSIAPFTNFKHYMYANFLNTITPANIGGDMYRFFSLKQGKKENALIINALIKERVLGVISYLVIYLVCFLSSGLLFSEMLYSGRQIILWAGIAGFFGVLGLLIIPYIFNRYFSLYLSKKETWYHVFILQILNALHFSSFKEMIKLLSLSFLALGVWIITVQKVALGFGENFSIFQLGLIVILVELIRLLPITIQGIGIREGLYAYMFSLFGRSPEVGFIIGTVSYLALSVSLLLSGLIGWLAMLSDKPKPEKV